MKNFRENPEVRQFFVNILDARKKRIQERYLRSPDSWYLKTLKGIHAGKRCFIIGNGPSLCAEDLDKLKDEYTFAANRIYEIFYLTEWRPTYYFVVDVPIRPEVYAAITKHAPNLGHILKKDPKDTHNEKISLEFPIEKLTRIFLEEDGYFKIYQNKYMESTCMIHQ